MELFEEYECVYQKYVNEGINEYADKINKPFKISGNVFSHVIRKNINEIVKSKYCVSPVNSYIKGCNIEWDLLILKEFSKEEKDYNVYFPKNVVCALEFKTSGAIYSNNSSKSVLYIKKYMDELKRINKKYQSNIKYGYISLCEIPNNLKAMDKAFHDNCFWLIRGYYGSRNKVGIMTKKDLKEFIVNLIK